jgi:hypothetical protein
MTVVEVAAQAGHTPETCLRHYFRLFRDAPADRVPAEAAIVSARAVAGLRVGRGADATGASGERMTAGRSANSLQIPESPLPESNRRPLPYH